MPRMNLNRRHFCIATSALAVAGCGPSVTPETPVTSETPGTPRLSGEVTTASYRVGDAEEFLQAVFFRYRGATSYHDRGRVRLTQVQDRKPVTRTAPMRIWLDRSELDLAVYDVRIAVESSRVMAWIIDESTQDFDSQVFLGTSKAERPQLSQALADPILAERISAGLAGPPPQVEWLFAAEPMKSLFDSPYQFRFLNDKTVQRRLCRCVEVSDGRDSYRFWVDPRASLIREVNLPPIVVPDPQTGQPQSLSIAIELVDASFDRPTQREPRDSFPKTPRYVSEFVPLPPPSPPQSWGRPAPRFDVTDSRGQFRLSWRGHDRDVAIVMRFDGDSASMSSLAMLDHWIKQSPQSFRERIRVLVAVSQDARLPDGVNLPWAIDSRGEIAGALGISSGAIAMIDRTGTLAWTEPMIGPGNIAAVSAVATDVADGVDVPKRLREQWEQEVARYRKAVLKRAVR
ncbi:hypothetical protein Pla22_17940 [Rubripirellula amarantea]|uniref:Uncharacterized protein n=1 Tax=Rubripirellula amarantea TaxID=2527999 RepID=A0A5C5WV79_9BACT|nr:hypothetical protein [Rubripirellula amarantea]TWT54159.1 hypothetical protein Pla22_17940 [Rubripirellula amarantea]